MSRPGPALIEALAATIRDLQARARSADDESGGSGLQLEHVTSELEATPALSVHDLAVKLELAAEWGGWLHGHNGTPEQRLLRSVLRDAWKLAAVERRKPAST